jgi:phosphatidate cytidylyltransferase
VTESDAAPAAAKGQGARNLLTRIAAALVLAPIAIATCYAGGRLFITLTTVVAVGLYIEWLMVVGAVGDRRIGISGTLALAVAGACLAFGRIEASWLVLCLGLLVVGVVSQQQRRWTAAGFVYAAATQMASILLRLDSQMGFSALVFVLLIVWVTDIGGYFAGRGIGGPKLWPRVSPKKTWAGAIAGFAASLAVAAVFATVAPHRDDPQLALKIGPLLGLGAVLSIISQLGDLLESAVKRRFGVKDSSHLIPGHGGLMDRLDGFIAAVVAAAIFGFLRGGVDGAGRALMVW